VFSLRSAEGFGVGEFSDLKLLVDWAASVGLKMIQVLPINDTIATNTFKDSYPYAAISAFALHPMYLNIKLLAGNKYTKQLKKLVTEGEKLNALKVVDYESVLALKMPFIKEVYKAEGAEQLASKDFIDFFEQNKNWLTAYAVFCYLRDEYGVVDFNKWPAYKHFNIEDIEALANPSSEAYSDIAFHYFVQYHLHLQLKEAAAYAHSKGVIMKGDIAIGVYRYSADTWQNPSLFHMEFQAGAPPDDFAIKGQNWGFPTYNWQKMQEDGFAWWKQRFEQMSHYFDAFRIDHILGFFRIWSIPINAVEGIMGHFVPALPIHIHEFNQQGIWFDYRRYTQPFITESVLWEYFGYDNELVKSLFLTKNDDGTFQLKKEFSTQRLVEAHFATLEADDQHQKIKQGIYNLISNVILFDANGDGQYFHFRFGMETTASFKYLSDETKQQLKNSYVNYFFKRQDDFWKQEAYQKLPSLKRVTNMIVCGEDLGLVPACVPDVMQQLGLLSLEIQRMPKDPTTAFFHPNDAPYLSVVTPSTHDMSTIRGWWEEDKTRIQQFYNNELGQWGDAPFYCEAWINKAIVVQHLYSPAMWSVFQIQDLMGINELVRREDPKEEQINIPADPNHYWQYRMHINIEDLQKASSFNEELAGYIQSSGR
jgi:4-alpha-glucanotransferase